MKGIEEKGRVDCSSKSVEREQTPKIERMQPTKTKENKEEDEGLHRRRKGEQEQGCEEGEIIEAEKLEH